MRGSIVKKGKKWYIVLDVIDPTGKRKRKWFSGYDKKPDAESALPDLLKKAQNGTLIDPKKITVKEFFEDWLKNQCNPRLSKTTCEGYGIHIKNFIVPEIGNIKLQKLQPIQLNNFFTTLLKKGELSSTTLRNIYRTISSALNYAVRMQLIEQNPLKFVECPKKKKSPGQALEPEGVIRIMQAAQGTEFEIPIHLAASLGHRRGEVLGLEWPDFNFDKKYVFVNRSLTRVTKEIFFKEPKTEESHRKTYLPEGLINLLKVHRKKQIKMKLLLGPEYKDHNLVVCHENGEPWNPATFSKRFQEFLEENNLPKIRFHDLRHTNSTLLIGYGKLSTKTVAAWLGQASTAMVDEVYTHINDQMKKEAANIIEQLIYKNMENNGPVEVR